MAKNEFLPFGLADGANVLTNDEYGKLIARTNGFSSGVAKSQELNKVWRQASVIATVIAQFIAETNNQDVLDDGNLATLQKGLLSALKATVSSNVPNASLTTAGITKLSNATDSNAENIAATSKAVRQVVDVVASGLDGKQDKGDYATNTALNQVNDNANSRLEKAKNGADIPDKAAFVNNLGLGDGEVNLEEAAFKAYFRNKNTPTSVFMNRDYTTSLSHRYSAILYAKTLNTYTAISAGVDGQGVKVVGGYDQYQPHVYELWTDRNTSTDKNGFLRNTGGADALTTAEGSALPVGVPIPWPLAIPPAGWLKCNGSTFTAGQYPELEKVYPSLRLPDLRGEFIRGWSDDSKEVDVGRALLSSQGDSFKAHNHFFSQTWASNANDYTGGPYPVSADSGGYLTDIHTIPTNNAGGDETRPRNIAFNYIVRAV